ncbi:hypothetical protein CsatB_008435 [Cannabis sativa]
MTPIVAYLEQGTLPTNKNEAKKMRRKATRYLIIDGVMYPQGYSVPLLRCVHQDQAQRLMEDVYEGFCVKSFSAVSHPQLTGQVEVVNKTLKDTLKKRLEEAKGNWPEHLREVLWSYRATERTGTGDTPFSLAYGYDAMIPIELDPPFHRRTTYNQVSNHQLMGESLDLLESCREASKIRLAAYQQKVARYFNSKVKERPNSRSIGAKLGRFV